MYSIKLSCEAFNDLASAAHFASSDMKRPPILTAVSFNLVGDTMTATASDSFKMVSIKRDIEELDGDYANMEEILVPAKTLTDYSKFIKKTKGSVTIKVNGEHLLFTSEAGVIGGEVIEGTYPKFDTIVPNATGIKATEKMVFNPHILAGFSKVAPFNSKNNDINALIITTINDNTRPMRVEDISGRTVGVIMPVRINGH